MSRVRFATARALYETFPKSVTRIAADPTDEPPIVFLKKLSAQEKLVDAVNFCAYLLPRREAVWWACGCVRSLLGEIPQSQAAGLLAAEAWVYEPDNEHRQAALDVGDQGDSNDPVNWLALAAGWSGGMLVSHPQAQTAMPTYMTPRAARIAIVLGTVKVRPAERTARIQACISEGIKLAETGLS